MLSVTHIDGRCEPLININNAEIEQEVNGDFILSFTSFSVHNPGYKLLTDESIVELNGLEFTVKNITEENGRKEILAIFNYFALIDLPKENMFGGTRTIDEAVSFLLEGTGWTYEIQGTFEAELLPNFGNDNPVALNQMVLDTFGCEIGFKPNKHLVYAKEIGEDKDEQLRIGHNIATIRKEVDTTDLVTVGRGKGADNLTVEWISPNAAIYGNRYGEIVVDERFTVSENLIEKVKQNTQDTPLTSIEITMVEIRKAGYTGSISLGDKVWIIDEAKDILVKLRVMKIVTFPFSNKSPIITFSNVKKTFTDSFVEISVEIEENRKDYRSRFDQTNEKIETEVMRLDGGIAEANTLITQTADSIRSEAAATKIELEGGIVSSNSLIEQTALAIRSEISTDITALDGKITAANSNITQTAAAIRAEVASEVTELDGKITTTNTTITQTATQIRAELSSEVIRMDGRIDTSNTSISTLAGQVSVKADSSTVTALGNRMSSAEFNISSLSGTISSKVSQTEYNGSTIASLINQSASNITIDVKALDLMAITTVAQTLYIGGEYNDGAFKQIRFGGALGGASIYSENPNVLNLWAGGGFINMESPTAFQSNVSFANATVDGLYAKFG